MAVRAPPPGKGGVRPGTLAVHPDDPGKGLIRIATLDEGAVKLAARLKQLGVHVCDEADFGTVGRLND